MTDHAYLSKENAIKKVTVEAEKTSRIVVSLNEVLLENAWKWIHIYGIF